MSRKNNNLPTDEGRIEKIFRKESHGKPTIELGPGEMLECIAGFGIQGDVHANRLSPRQILVTLQSELDELQIAAGALRENLVISTNSAEMFRPGSALITDKGVEINLTMFCEPCKRISSVVPDLGSMINRRGILGYIEKGGAIQIGDAVSLVASRYSPLPESPYQKFLDFVSTIPAGKVVRYLDVTIAMGVADSFVRAVPGYIKRSVGNNIPLHRIVNAQGNLLTYVPNQAKILAEEGIAVKMESDLFGESLGKIELESHLWQG
jgi:alkylated DNA nucleotide flippase Atl1